MGQQSRHAKLGDGWENPLHGAELHLTLGAAAKFIRKGCGHFIPHSVRDNDIYPVICRSHLHTIEFRLPRHLKDSAVFPQIVLTGHRPAFAQFSQEPVAI